MNWHDDLLGLGIVGILLGGWMLLRAIRHRQQPLWFPIAMGGIALLGVGAGFIMLALES